MPKIKSTDGTALHYEEAGTGTPPEPVDNDDRDLLSGDALRNLRPRNGEAVDNAQDQKH